MEQQVVNKTSDIGSREEQTQVMDGVQRGSQDRRRLISSDSACREKRQSGLQGCMQHRSFEQAGSGVQLDIGCWVEL